MTKHLSTKSAVRFTKTNALVASVSSIFTYSQAAPSASTTSSTTTTTAATTSATNSAVVPTDGQITSLMMAANQAEIDEAKMAKSKAQNKAVKDFANHMMTEHSKNEKEGKDLAKKVGVKPNADFAPLVAMKKDAAAMSSQLQKAKGLEFDKAYMANQIAMHQDLLAKLNDQLIPNAKNTEIRNYLESTKSHVQAHLDMAKSVQSQITAQ